MAEMKDSGKRQGFDTGAVRDTAEGKPDYGLLPPFAWSFVHPEYGNLVFLALIDEDPAGRFQQLYGQMITDMGTDRLLEWLRQGAEKYSAWNWAKGMPVSRCLASLGRHLAAMKRGDDDEDHGAAAMCNVSFIVHYLEGVAMGHLPPEINDLFNFDREGAANEQS
jgi:hypothetical protein